MNGFMKPVLLLGLAPATVAAQASQYTKPPVWEGRAIPPVLLSGDHGKIAAWRRREALRLTAERRPDLLSTTNRD